MTPAQAMTNYDDQVESLVGASTAPSPWATP